ncbi:hypothetical protein TcasGA2_TC015988 [Tribolium castaneum]|uniref:Uncharacterized protein n=1 Tax=Tribolium castaneum TaxID=7070 RepID=D6WYB1_TRICA|nr:hypothetical protein TcasGA2_TC015988 [Tribolium castaneum]
MPSYETQLRIFNNTFTDIKSTSVSGTDNYDWDGGSRPDYNFVGVYIKAKSAVQRRAEVNRWAKNCPFTMTLCFQDRTIDTFRLNQKAAIGKANIDLRLLRVSHKIIWRRTDKKTLEIEIQNTEQQLQEQVAEKLKKEGEASAKQKQYEAALKKLDEALKLTHKASTIAECKNQQGDILMAQAWDLELKENAALAEKKFKEAKEKFSQAGNQEKVGLVNLKLDGNKLFNEANELEAKAFELVKNAKTGEQLNSAQDMYREVLAKYEEAKKKFDEGAKRDKVNFGESATFVKSQIDEVQKVINDIEKAELNLNMNEVHVNDEEKKTEGEEEVNKDLHEERDG